MNGTKTLTATGCALGIATLLGWLPPVEIPAFATPAMTADVIDKNPLTVDPMTIKGIKVVETIKDGKTIYRRG